MITPAYEPKNDIYIYIFTCVSCSIFHLNSSNIFKYLLFDLRNMFHRAPASVAKGAKALFEVPAGNMGAVTRAATGVMGIATAVTIPRFNMTTMVEMSMPLSCHVQARSSTFNEIR